MNQSFFELGDGFVMIAVAIVAVLALISIVAIFAGLGLWRRSAQNADQGAAIE
jgi:Tfp pilus assembly protein PilE